MHNIVPATQERVAIEWLYPDKSILMEVGLNVLASRRIETGCLSVFQTNKVKLTRI